MPFSEEFTDIYESGIKSIGNQFNVKIERLDEQIYDSDMLAQIYKNIETSDFIIADMSGRNANVFYEVGYADAKKKLIILLTQKSEDIPFDLKHRPHVVYEGSIKKLKEQLESRVEWAVKEIDRRNQNQLNLKLTVRNTSFERGENSDEVKLNYALEISNLTDTKITGLELIYLHTGNGWTFFKDNKALKQIKSDIPPFPIRHFLSPDVSIIPKNDSISIEFFGKKIVWQSWKDKNEDRKDEYQFQGRIVAVIHSEKLEKRFDFNLDSKVTYHGGFDDDIPFYQRVRVDSPTSRNLHLR